MTPDRLRFLARTFLELRALPTPTGEERLLRVVLAGILVDAARLDGSGKPSHLPPTTAGAVDRPGGPGKLQAGAPSVQGARAPRGAPCSAT